MEPCNLEIFVIQTTGGISDLHGPAFITKNLAPGWEAPIDGLLIVRHPICRPLPSNFITGWDMA